MAANPSIQLGTDGNWAIKEDNLLAYKKDGTRFFNKEFDFTRGSLATFVDKDGLIKVSGVTDTELVVNGDFATDSDWSKAGSVEILNGLASFTITSGSFAKISQNISLTNNKIYKLTLQVLGDNSGSNIYVRDTATGDNGGLQEVITLVEGTTDYTFYFTANANSNAIYIKRNTSSGNYQFSIDNVSVKEIQTDVPRIDFTDDATGHLLLEPQSTNKIPYSEDFTQWSNADVTIESGYVAPDGTNSAFKVTKTGSNANIVTSGVLTSDARTIYAKTTNGSGTIQLLSHNTNTNNLFTVTEQWQRFQVNSAPEISNNFYAIDFRGAGTTLDEVIIWGAQSEALSYATSYIPTYGSAATRNAEACNNSGSAQDFNSEEGVLYYEAAAQDNSITTSVLSISSGSNANTLYSGFSSTSNTIQAQLVVGGVTQTNMNYVVSDRTDFNKIAILYQNNNHKMYVNGVEVAVDTNGSVPSANTFDRLNFDLGQGSFDFYGKTKNLKVFKRAMSDGELYLLTVTQYQSYQEMATALNYTL